MAAVILRNRRSDPGAGDVSKRGAERASSISVPRSTVDRVRFARVRIAPQCVADGGVYLAIGARFSRLRKVASAVALRCNRAALAPRASQRRWPTSLTTPSTWDGLLQALSLRGDHAVVHRAVRLSAGRETGIPRRRAVTCSLTPDETRAYGEAGGVRRALSWASRDRSRRALAIDSCWTSITRVCASQSGNPRRLNGIGTKPHGNGTMARFIPM